MDSKNATKLTDYEKLMALLTKTGKDDFEISPKGYGDRLKAMILQLCLTPNPTVQIAMAQSPIIRDMFIEAMARNVKNKNVLAVVMPIYEANKSKTPRWKRQQVQQAEALTAEQAKVKKLMAKVAKMEKAAKK